MDNEQINEQELSEQGLEYKEEIQEEPVEPVEQEESDEDFIETNDIEEVLDGIEEDEQKVVVPKLENKKHTKDDTKVTVSKARFKKTMGVNEFLLNHIKKYGK